MCQSANLAKMKCFCIMCVCSVCDPARWNAIHLLLHRLRRVNVWKSGCWCGGEALTFIKPPPSPSLPQLQREASPEASRVHLPPGEAAELGGELLRGPLCHPDTGPAQNGNCRPRREEMIREITEALTPPLAFISVVSVRFSALCLLCVCSSKADC